MKHVRLLIFFNWICKKAGDKVPHTPLILPISIAGAEACCYMEEGIGMENVAGKRARMTDEECWGVQKMDSS